jgi:hypothetical protein
MMRQSENEHQNLKTDLGNYLIDPLYNKNVGDYNDNFQTCIKTSDDANQNKTKKKSTSNLVFDIEYIMCHSNKPKMCMTYQSYLPLCINMMCTIV